MKFKPGDQVSFVNEKGGGIIIAITKNGKYKVALEDGFDLTLPENELALVKSSEMLKEPEIKSSVSDLAAEFNEKLFLAPADEVTFITVPAYENRILTGEVAFYLVNNTAYHLYFILSSVTGRDHFLIESSDIAPGEEKLTGQFLREDLTDWDHLHIQVLFYQVGSFKFIPPVQKDLPVLLPDLNSTNKENGRLAFAKKFSVFRVSVIEDLNLDQIKQKFIKGNEKKEVPKIPVPKRKHYDSKDDFRFGILRNTKEVDLHINVLLKDNRLPDHAEMLEIQLKHFRKEMDDAVLNHYHSITFIHGVGEGVLKNALITELKFYPDISYRNGPYEKYGAGAIEVLLK